MAYVVKSGHKGQWKLTAAGLVSRSIERAQQFVTAAEAQAAADALNAAHACGAYVYDRATRRRVLSVYQFPDPTSGH